jgi:hypothetical protein
MPFMVQVQDGNDVEYRADAAATRLTRPPR